MAVSRTYADMYNRIADELGGRTDLLANQTGMTTPPIQLAIQDAINYWQDDRFYFNEIRTATAFSTVASREFYTVTDWSEIPNLKHIDKLTVVVGTQRYQMNPRTAQYIEDIAVNPATKSVPFDYAYYGGQLRFYPIPDAVYAVNFLGTKTFAELTLAADTNVWVNDAEQLIRTTAEWFLYRDTLKDDVGAQRMERASGVAYSNLKGQNAKRAATNRITATQF